jgi:hypothetical protein
MLPPVIGIAKRVFTKNENNTFRVYGENFDDTSVELKARLKCTKFDWTPDEILVANSDRKKHYVVLKSKPNPKSIPAPPMAAAAAHGVASLSGTDDDLTITLVFDEGGPQDTSISEDYTVIFIDPGP